MGTFAHTRDICAHDLGFVLTDERPDSHETFREHYPDGYRMEFVPAKDVRGHSGLMAAYRKNQARLDK